MNELIDSNHEKVTSLYSSLEEALEMLEEMFKDCKPSLNGECYLTDEELSKRLKVSRRSLQDYRTEGILPYIRLRGKILYRESDIEALLEKSYKKAWRSAE
ncbi:MAG: helix-turn-helix domain-containing protein [Bacteroides sp.]|nr:helix-turn-helix domain-containing protein [Bacteroides sp.]